MLVPCPVWDSAKGRGPGKKLINWRGFGRRFPKWLGLEHLPCDERLRKMDLFSPEKRASGGPKRSFPIHMRWEDKRNGYKLKAEKFQAYTSRNFYAVNRLLGDVMQSPSLDFAR